MKCSVFILLLAVAGLVAGSDVNADINSHHKRHKKHKHHKKSLRVVPGDEVGNGLKDLSNGLHKIVLGEAKPIMELDKDKSEANEALESVAKDLKTAQMEEKKMAVLAKNLASERILLEQTRASADAFDTDGVKVVQAQSDSVAAMLKKTSDLIEHSKEAAIEASKRALRRATEVNQAAVASQHAAEARQAEAAAAEKQYFDLQKEAGAEKKNVADISIPKLESTLKKPEIVAAPAAGSLIAQKQNNEEPVEEEEEEVYED